MRLGQLKMAAWRFLIFRLFGMLIHLSQREICFQILIPSIKLFQESSHVIYTIDWDCFPDSDRDPNHRTS